MDILTERLSQINYVQELKSQRWCLNFYHYEKINFNIAHSYFHLFDDLISVRAYDAYLF